MIQNFGRNYTMNGVWNPYNPMMSAPQRLARMEQQYAANPYSNMFQPVQSAQLLKGRAVSSFEEARAAMIDLDGSLHIFPDIGNKMIYTKQINLDGTSSLNVYKLVDNSETQENTSPFVSLNMFDDAIGSLQNQINDLSDMIRQRSTKHENISKRKSNDVATNDVFSTTE